MTQFIRRLRLLVSAHTVALWAVALLLSGCATWVNIPAHRGDMASHNPNTATVREVMFASLQRSIDREPPRGQYAIALPPNTAVNTYTWILNRLPQGGGRLRDEAGEIPLYRVAQVQVRAADAQVDVIPLIGSEPAQLRSVYLKWDTGGWYVHRDRVWRMPVIEALQLARPWARPERLDQYPPMPAMPPERDGAGTAPPTHSLDSNQPIR